MSQVSWNLMSYFSNFWVGRNKILIMKSSSVLNFFHETPHKKICCLSWAVISNASTSFQVLPGGSLWHPSIFHFSNTLFVGSAGETSRNSWEHSHAAKRRLKKKNGDMTWVTTNHRRELVGILVVLTIIIMTHGAHLQYTVYIYTWKK